MVIGVAAMLCAAVGFVLSYAGNGPLYGYAGGAVGVILGLAGVVLAIRTDRSMRLPINAIVMSVLFIAAGATMGQLGLQTSQQQEVPPEQQAQRLRNKIQACNAQIRMLEGQLQNLEEQKAALTLRPELAQRVTMHGHTARYLDEDTRLHNGDLKTYRYLVLDVEVENQTGHDFDGITFDIQYVVSSEQGAIHMPVIETNTPVPHGETTTVPIRVKRYDAPTPGSQDNLPALTSITWQDVRFLGATAKDETGIVHPVIGVGLNRGKEQTITHMEHTLSSQQAMLAEHEAELAAIEQEIGTPGG